MRGGRLLVVQNNQSTRVGDSHRCWRYPECYEILTTSSTSATPTLSIVAECPSPPHPSHPLSPVYHSHSMSSHSPPLCSPYSISSQTLSPPLPPPQLLRHMCSTFSSPLHTSLNPSQTTMTMMTATSHQYYSTDCGLGY
jgi:hypothetical protein